MNSKIPSVFTLSGLSCGSCVAKITARLKEEPELESVEVTLEPPMARVSADRVVSVEEMNRWLKPLGRYRAEAAASTASGASADLAADGKPRGKMASAPEAESKATASEPDPEPSASAVTYRPLLVLVGYLLAVTAAVNVAAGGFDAGLSMRVFMGGFFVAFSFFKMLDLPGFASAYRGYDLVAAKVPVWGFIYPFVELGLGLAYLSNWQPFLVNAVTAVVMAVSLAGVLRAVLSKQKIRCACLGTVFNLPMSTVTIIEDGVMLAMAVAAMVWH